MDLAMPGMDMESVMLMLSPRLMLSMVIVDTLLLAMGMGMDLAMPGMDMESLMLSQRLMLSTILMEDMVLDTVFILLVMDMDIVMLTLCQRLMLSMEPMPDMATDLDIVHTPLDTVLDMVMDMDMDTDMDTMVELYIIKSAEPLMTT